MNEIQIFKHADFGEVRTVNIDGEPWLVGKDVAVILGYENSSKAIRDHVDHEDKVVGVQNVTPSIIDNFGRKQYPTFINESGLYSLVLSSKLPTARKFRRWVTSEVLPTIRKTGGYVSNEQMFIDTYLPNADEHVKAMFKTTLKELRQANEKIETDKPKVLFADAVTTANTSILIGELAKLMKQNGVEIGQNRLFTELRQRGFLIRRKGSDYNMPTQYSMERGLFEIKETAITHSDGHISVSKTPKVTGKGQIYFVNLFLKDLQAV